MTHVGFVTENKRAGEKTQRLSGLEVAGCICPVPLGKAVFMDNVSGLEIHTHPMEVASQGSIGVGG